MSDTPQPAAGGDAPPEDPFRWQAFFQRSADPLFLLNAERRILFVNRAWEALTGLTRAQVRGLKCRRHRLADAASWEDALADALCPPPEVRAGRPGRTRRQVADSRRGPTAWDVDFFPLRAAGGGLLGIVGRVTPGPAEARPAASPLPEGLAAVRLRRAQRFGLEHLASNLPPLRRLTEQVRLACQTRVPVLLLGEPGTGKQWLARTIHHQGPTHDGPFASMDGRLPPVWPAPVWDAGGTCYLREPARLPHELQARLCARLAEGADAPGPRLLAGCATDPVEDVRAGRLMGELYGALATLVIPLPPLRERREDLPLFVERLLERAGAAAGRTVVGLTAEAWDVVRHYSWTGNLRELYAVLRQACLRARGDRVDAADLPSEVRGAVRLDQTPAAPAERSLPLEELLQKAERRLILLALERARGNKSRAAEVLSLWRQRLLRRMEVLGIGDGAPDEPGE